MADTSKPARAAGGKKSGSAAQKAAGKSKGPKAAAAKKAAPSTEVETRGPVRTTVHDAPETGPMPEALNRIATNARVTVRRGGAPPPPAPRRR